MSEQQAAKIDWIEKRRWFLNLSDQQKMRHCVFCCEEFGPNVAGHINCGGGALDVKLPEESASRLAPASGEADMEEMCGCGHTREYHSGGYGDCMTGSGCDCRGFDVERLDPGMLPEPDALVASQPPSALHNAGSGKQGGGKGEWAAEELSRAELQFEEEVRLATPRVGSQSFASKEREARKEVVARLQCELNALRERLAAGKVTWRVDRDFGEGFLNSQCPFMGSEYESRKFLSQVVSDEKRVKRCCLLKITTISEVIETKLAGEEG